MPDTVTLEVFRYRPEDEEEPTFETFEVPFREDWMVLDALVHIKDHLDGTLSFRWSCRMGVCGSCGMMVNGVPVLTCATWLEELLPGPARVEPLRGFPVVRDLVGDIGDFIEKLSAVHAWLVPGAGGPPSGEYLQTPAERAEYEQYSRCINCMLCYAACPIYELEAAFVGPAAIALAQRWNLDSRDEGSSLRNEVLSAPDGIWACTFVGECTTVCPAGVDPAGAIQRYKLQAAAHWFRTLLPVGR